MILRGLLSKKDAIYYIISQLAGAFLAALFVFWSEGELMKIKPSDIATVFQILSVEFIFTFILIIVILYVATEKSTAGNSYYGLAIGFTILVASFVGGEISGGAFNPAVGTGPILVEIIIGEGSTLTNLWYYIVGPIIGAVVASYVYKLTTD
jgi:aquaporin Z